MIEVIQILAHTVTGIERPGLAVGRVEARRETAEEFGHGDIRLAIAVVHRRVEDHRFVVRGRRGIAAPEIAVQQRRHRTVIGEKRRQLFQ